MPFRIPSCYTSWSVVGRDPTLQELHDYVMWLTEELVCAKLALEAKKPPVPKPQPVSPVNTFAQSGGKARANKLTPEQRKEQAKRAAAQRWKKKPTEEVTTPIPVDPVPQGE